MHVSHWVWLKMICSRPPNISQCLPICTLSIWATDWNPSCISQRFPKRSQGFTTHICCRVATQTHTLSVFKTLNSVGAKRLIRPDDDETHDEKQVALIYRLHWKQINELEPKKPLFAKCKFSSLPRPQLYGATINKENCLDLRCTTRWFDTHMYCEMLATTVNTSITSHSYLPLSVCAYENVKKTENPVLSQQTSSIWIQEW